MKKLKQVIVVRNDLNMRKGKMIAQGAHASIGALMASATTTFTTLSQTESCYTANFWPNATEWMNSNQKKISVYVNSEQELLDIHKKAKELGLPCHLVQDAGMTEFDGLTYTAVGIGPAEETMVDQVTGNLKLL